MNFLQNPNFDEGHHHQDNITEIVVPDGWRLYWLDNVIFPGSASPAYRPESTVWWIYHAPEVEKPLFFLTGDFCWKVFKAFAPLYFAVTQTVTGLTPGQRYRFTAKVFPDIVEEYSPTGKIWARDIWAAEARAGWSAPDTPWPEGADGDIAWTEWFNIHNGNFAFGQYCDVWVEFVAPEDGRAQIWLECKAKWGFANNWFMDAFTLTEVASPPEPEPQPEPEPEPEPELPSPRGKPRVQYERTYVLMPSDCPTSWMTAVARVALPFQVTLGFSADDAGIGDLDSRTVIAVAPSHIGTGLTAAWYAENYPGVTFIPLEVNSAIELEQRLSELHEERGNG